MPVLSTPFLADTVARVRNNGSFFQSNVCSLFLRDFAAVRVIGVSVIAELLTVAQSAR